LASQFFLGRIDPAKLAAGTGNQRKKLTRDASDEYATSGILMPRGGTMKALLVCGLIFGMVCADSISSLSQGSLMRYAVCAKVKVIRGVRVIKCAKRPTPLPDPTQNLKTVCAGVGAEFNSYEEAVSWMQVNCN
jgi:hypothetical protein